MFQALEAITLIKRLKKKAKNYFKIYLFIL